MIVNGKKYDMETLLKDIDFNALSFKKVGNLMLTVKEIDILERNYIDYTSASSLKDLMIKIREVVEDEEYDEDCIDELDYVLDAISERDYYENTNK